MNYLSLFSGVGGFELGINNAWQYMAEQRSSGESLQLKRDMSGSKKHSIQDTATCIGFSEIDKYAIQTYEKNWKGHTNYGSATEINERELPDFELLVGGFPCQAFSVAGKRAGFNDTRGTLFFDIARILKHKRPRHILLENVKGLLSHDSGKTMQTIAKVLTDLGYRIEWQVLNAKDYGVPQNRERIFIVGHLAGECAGQVFPIRENDSVNNGQDKQVPQSAERGSPNKLNNNSSVLEDGKERPIHIRKLTPTECERLMSWPDGWTEGVSDTQRYKQCGNGVVSNCVQAVIGRMLEKGCL